MFKFRSYKQHYIDNIKLAIPVILANLGQMVVQLVDNAMVGHLGAVPLAAASFANSAFFMVFLFSTGITMGITPLVGERFAKRKYRESAAYLQNGLVAFTICGVFIALFQLSIIPLMSHMGQPQEIVDMSIPYYTYMCFSMIPMVIFSVFRQFLEGIGNTKLTMIVMLTANVLNVIGNYILINGKFGFPAMGVDGAGLSTFIVRCLMPVMIFAMIYNQKKIKRYFKLFSTIWFDAEYIKRLFRTGLPIATQLLIECTAFCMIGIMAGWLEIIEIAKGDIDAGYLISGNQIAMSIGSTFFMVILGIESATTIRISHLYGVGNLREMNRAGLSSLHLCLLWDLIAVILIIGFREQIPRFFTDDSGVIDVASRLLLFIAIFQISDGIQSTFTGILRGMNDTKRIMITAAISYLLIGMPLGYFCAFTLDFGTEGLWIGIIVGLTTVAISLGMRYRSLYLNIRRSKLRRFK